MRKSLFYSTVLPYLLTVSIIVAMRGIIDTTSGLAIVSVSILIFLLYYELIIRSVEKIQRCNECMERFLKIQSCLMMEMSSDGDISREIRSDAIKVNARMRRAFRRVNSEKKVIGAIWLKFEIVEIQEAISSMFMRIIEERERVRIAKEMIPTYMLEVPAKLHELKPYMTPLIESTLAYLQYESAIKKYDAANTLFEKHNGHYIEIYDLLVDAHSCIEHAHDHLELAKKHVRPIGFEVQSNPQ